MDEREETKRWYAAKAFRGRAKQIGQELAEEGEEYFIPELMPSLLFLRVGEAYLKKFEEERFERVWVYRGMESRKPLPIPEREMEVFMFVCTAGKQGLTYLGEDRPEYHQGDLVRVTDGPFKGAEGYIKRIKKDRRLVVSIKGVVAVATTYIHPQFLEIVKG